MRAGFVIRLPTHSPTASRARRYRRRVRPPNKASLVASQMLFLPAIQAGDAEGVRSPTGFAEAGLAHAVQHLLRLWETFHRIGEILVRAAYAGNHGAHTRQDLLEIDAVQVAHQALGFAEVEDAALPPRL